MLRKFIQAYPKFWNHLSRIELLRSLGTALGVGGTMTVIGVWLSRQIDFISGQGWAAITLVGIVLGLLGVTALGVLIVGTVRFAEWRKHKHLASDSSHQPQQTALLPEPEAILAVKQQAAVAETRLAQIDGDLRTALIRINAMEGTATVRAIEFDKRLEERLEGLTEHQRVIEVKLLSAVSDAKAHTETGLDGTRTAIIHLLNEVRAKYDTITNNLTKLQELTFTIMRARDPERMMKDLDSDIALRSNILSAADAERYPTEEAWHADYCAWSRNVNEFWTLIRGWNSSVEDPFAPPDADYRYPDIIPNTPIFATHKIRSEYHMLAIVSQRHSGFRKRALEYIGQKATPP